jgi:hypothetical protein
MPGTTEIPDGLAGKLGVIGYSETHLICGFSMPGTTETPDGIAGKLGVIGYIVY